MSDKYLLIFLRLRLKAHEISENHGEYNSSLSVSFARELEDILNSNMMKSCFTD